MRKLDTGSPSERSVRLMRANPDRFFHIMAEGWYIYTREGVRGPFIDKPLATNYLQRLIDGIDDKEDPSSAWRL